MKYRNEFSFLVEGRYALFSDPITRIGGEKCTYQIPTYESLKGICSSIFWKPEIILFIDKCRVLEPIVTESKGIRPVKYSGSNDLSSYTYLRNVRYEVKAHFEFNPIRVSNPDVNLENKYYYMMKRCIEKGGRRDIFLGTRECSAYVSPVNFEENHGYYDNSGNITFGIMYHSISYPDENNNSEMRVNLWNANMNDGIISFCSPEECQYSRVIQKQSIKKFYSNNFTGLTNEDELLKEYEGGE